MTAQKEVVKITDQYFQISGKQNLGGFTVQ